MSQSEVEAMTAQKQQQQQQQQMKIDQNCAQNSTEEKSVTNGANTNATEDGSVENIGKNGENISTQNAEEEGRKALQSPQATPHQQQQQQQQQMHHYNGPPPHFGTHQYGMPPPGYGGYQPGPWGMPWQHPPQQQSEQPAKNLIVKPGVIEPQVIARAAEWSEHRAPDGRPYYYHAGRGESVWEKPQAIRDLEGKQKL